MGLMVRCASTLFACALMVIGTSRVHARDAAYAVIPKPAQLTPGEGHFTLRDDTLVVIPDAVEMNDLARYLIDRVGPGTGFRLRFQLQTFGEAPQKNAIVLAIVNDDALGDEGYTLTSTPDSIRIAARKPAGLFYGVQTLRQLLPTEVESPVPVAKADRKSTRL